MAGLLEDKAHEESIQLANFYCLVKKSLAEKSNLKYQRKAYDIGAQHDYVAKLGNFANALRRAGRDKEAKEITQEVLKIFQQLAKKSPDRFDPDYATSLNNYANDLDVTGRNDEALEHSLQALEIRERLGKKSPDRFDPDYASSLNNYANHLGDAGRNDEALEHSRQALEIRERLAKKSPDRFDPDYASSLCNYANDLGDAGRNHEALEHSRQALEIRERLAKKNPDRFDPYYATSLKNYANHLGDAGRNDEALEHSRQALEICERLAKKNPARFSEEQFLTAYDAHFLAWLASNRAASDPAEWSAIPETTPPHRRPLLHLYACFVQACHAPDAASRADSFKQVVQLWNELSRANKTSAVKYWLCAAAWCGTYELAAVVDVNWQTEWHQFLNRRQGYVPCWMQTVAQRLKFQWPE
jgi:tetratricopeptide (TPR) repeat protein